MSLNFTVPCEGNGIGFLCRERNGDSKRLRDLVKVLLPVNSGARILGQVSDSYTRHWTSKWSYILLWQEIGDGWNGTTTTCSHTWPEFLEFQDTPQSTGLCQQDFSRGTEVIWESGCQCSFSDLPAPSNNIDPTFLPAASGTGQPRLTSVGSVQGTGSMNSSILCWPTLAPLF